MPVSELHRRIAAVVLSAAGAYGFALGGGNALLAYGVISRPTQDVDLFTDREDGVAAAAGSVEAALRGAGFEPERQDQVTGLVDLFPDMGEGLAEWIVTGPDGAQIVLQLAYFDRGRDPVVMDVGPVLDLEDVVGGKICALASRVEPRDYADVAAVLEHYSPAQLIGFARRLDPGLTGQDFAEAGLRLDRMDDRVFAGIGLNRHDVARLRERLAAWPRSAREADWEVSLGKPSGHPTAPGGTPVASMPEPDTREPDRAGGRQQQTRSGSAAQPERDDPEAEP